MHDFNPGITPNGVFWIVQVPDSAVQITEDSISINLQNVAVVDQGHFPGGTGTAPVTLSFQATYVKTGAPRIIRPATHDPLSPFNWAGKMWMATNSGSFSVVYNDGSFTAQGTFSSSGNFGELGRERNGVFAQNHDNDDAEDTNAVFVVPSEIEPKDAETSTRPALEEGVWSRPILKGRLPLKGLERFVPVK